MFTNVTLLYFLLLIPLSGFIAWLGDRIGHKSGKRRHTLFGLRPRHTAMVFTIGTGMCISFVSFGLMWLFSETFRIVVRDGVRLYEANRQYKQQNIILNTSNGRLQREVTRRRDEAKNAGAILQEATAEKGRALGERNSARQQELEAQIRAKTAGALVEQEKMRLVTAQFDLLQKQHALTGVKGTLNVRSKQLKEAELQVALAREQVASAHGRVDLATSKAGEAELKLYNVRKAAEAALREQSLALAGLHKQLDDQTALFRDQGAKIDAQRKSLADLDSQVESGRRELALIRTNTQALREHQITYQVGDEVDRIEIKPGYNVWRIEAILQSFMTTAAKKAEFLGARRDKSSERAIVILPQKVLASEIPGSASSSASPGETKLVNEDDAIRYASESIRRSNSDVVVLLKSTANAVAGEPVAVDLTLNPNPVVFTAETQIADAHVDGDGTRQQVADAVFSFMRVNVRTTLLKAGIIPHSRRGDDTSGSVINLSGDEWITLMDRVREAGSRARIVVTANRDIRAGDSLDDALHIDVKGVQNTAFRSSN